MIYLKIKLQLILDQKSINKCYLFPRSTSSKITHISQELNTAVIRDIAIYHLTT